MRAADEPAVSELVLESFRASVAGSYSADGVTEFERLAAPEQFATRARRDHDVLLAEADGRLIGMIAIREKRHIAMLFVEPGRRGSVSSKQRPPSAGRTLRRCAS
jgi:acetyltransferase (GNAT) family protein